MDYAKALKQVQSEKVKDNFIVIELSYNNHIVLPHKDGIALLNALINAEQYKTDYGVPPKIYPMELSITSKLMSRHEYEQIKIANLLNVTMAELAEHSKAA